EPEMESEPETEPEMESEPDEEDGEKFESIVSKFGSQIRKKTLTPSQIKSVINTVISSVDLAQLSMEERNIISKSFKKGERVDENDMEDMNEGKFNKFFKGLGLNKSATPIEVTYAIENFILESTWNNTKVNYNEISKFLNKEAYEMLDESIKDKVKPLSSEENKYMEENEEEMEEYMMGGVESDDIDDMPLDHAMAPSDITDNDDSKSIHVDLKNNTVDITLKEEKIRKFINAITEEKLGLRKLSTKVKKSKNYKKISEMVEKEINKQKLLKEQNELKSVIQEAIDDALNNI
ncbi:MAG: hypothetical protein ACOC33_02290, partial [bacterium]